MTKLLGVMLLSSVLGVNVFAAGDSCEEGLNENKHSKYEPSNIYLRTDLIGHKFRKEYIAGVSYKNKNYSYGADIGLGYYVMDRVRAECVINYNFMTRFKAATNNNIYKSKATAKALFLRGMLDVISLGNAKFFVGAGAGLARTFNKVHVVPNIGAMFQYVSKSQNSFAYSFHAGASMDIAEGVILEASWGMRNYGSTSHLTDSRDKSRLNGSKIKLRSRDLALGLRFDV